MSKRVLVTGGTGVVGGWVVRELLGKGYEPVILDLRPNFDFLKEVKDQIKFVQGDIIDLEAVKKVLAENDIQEIVHLAALVFVDSQRDPYRGYAVNVTGSLNIFESARLLGCKKVVFISSRAVYADFIGEYAHPTYKPVAEDYPRDPKNVYGATKHAVEQAAFNFCKQYPELTITGLRFPSMYGPGRLVRHGNVALLSKLIESAMLGIAYHVPQGSDQKDDLIYVGDAARAAVLALVAETKGFNIFNIGSGNIISFGELLAAMNKVIKGSQVSVGPGLDFLNSGVSTARYCSLDVAKASKMIGWQPAFDIETGIVDYVDTMHKLGFSPLLGSAK